MSTLQIKEEEKFRICFCYNHKNKSFDQVLETSLVQYVIDTLNQYIFVKPSENIHFAGVLVKPLTVKRR